MLELLNVLFWGWVLVGCLRLIAQGVAMLGAISDAKNAGRPTKEIGWGWELLPDAALWPLWIALDFGRWIRGKK